MDKNRNYRIMSGMEIQADPELPATLMSYDILTITRIDSLGDDRFLFRSRVLDDPDLRGSEICPVSEYLFYNKSLFTDPVIRSIFENRQSDEYEFTISGVEAHHLNHFSEIMREYQSDEDHLLGERYIANILSNLVMYLKLVVERSLPKYAGENLSGKQGAYRDKGLRFKELAQIHHRKNRNVAFYADLLAIDRRTLSNITKHVLERTPKEMIDECLIGSTKILMNEKRELSIKQIAFLLGFTSLNHFYVFFRKVSELTPQQYRLRN